MKAVFLIGVLLLAPQRGSTSITGKWLWQGTAGWQRIVLDLKADGVKLTGLIRMGPGGSEPKSPADYWEYFFDPTDFKILNGKIEGNTIYFEHEYGRSAPTLAMALRGATNASFNSNVESKFVYRGTIQGDRISLTREMVSKAQDPWSVGTHKTSFAVERVN